MININSIITDFTILYIIKPVTDYTGPMCIIMGAEDKGVSYDNLALCDEWVKIPMLGTIESLNVSVAAGILIYEAVKQRTN